MPDTPARLRLAGLRRPNLTQPKLAPVTLALGAGECLAITGPSGAGKSLILRMIADLDPHEGEAYFDGMPRSAMPGPVWRRQVCYAPAEPGWWAETVGAHFAGPPLELAARLGLRPALFAQSPALCSTGERQRLALMRVLATVPPVLLLDEPTAALDETATGQVEAELTEALQRGAAIILVTHNLAQAARLGTRHAALSDGALRET